MDLDIWGYSAVVVRVLVYGGTTLAVGSVMFLAVFSQEQQRMDRITRVVGVFAALVAIAASGAVLLLRTGYLIDDGLGGMFDPDILQLVVAGPAGYAAMARTIGLICIGLALAVPAVRIPAGAVGALLAVGSFVLVGHSTAEPRLLLAALIMAHLLAISFWIGALVPLHVGLAPGADREATGALAERFGRIAVYVVSGLVAAGVLFLVLRVADLWRLSTSGYGQALVAKLFVVTGLMLLAAMNKTRYVPDLVSGKASAGIALRRSIRLEAAAFAAIFMATATMTTLTGIPGAN